MVLAGLGEKGLNMYMYTLFGCSLVSKDMYRIFRAITRALSVDFFVFKAAARYRPVRVM